MDTRESNRAGIPSRRQSAFTLIELLVVIAIIALLVAILLPSLDAARRQAKQNACLSHIKNIATSSRVYEADDQLILHDVILASKCSDGSDLEDCASRRLDLVAR